ncbi:MAG: winged helix DNA-binding domain-containing protein [Pelagimonas sp.]|jgi:uncharacterized protein YcaQ|nr:winged helix DNA-binding domain-containing protein [Pelagimonas sp.]
MSMRRLSNAQARRVFLDRHLLSEVPVGPSKGVDLADLITRLGFVQLDSVRTVERAHHMILFARRQSYRPKHLDRLNDPDRLLFEHWTHDAATVPMAFYPYWHMRFRRDAALLRQRYKKWRGHEFDHLLQGVLDHIRHHGPVSSSDLGQGEAGGNSGWWDWKPSKTALEFLWRSGAIAVTRRDGFRKVYDLTERVVPPDLMHATPSEDETTHWLCHAAFERLGFATPGEIAAFWDTLRPHEAKAWCDDALERGVLEPVEIECVGGKIRKSLMLAGSDLNVSEPPGRLRVLSPFDPALRDRQRAERLFGFHYRIEIFVPEAKRQYGYYVFPLLEGARLVGRIDMAARKETGALHVTAVWPEAGVRWGDGRQARLEAELTRLARFAGMDCVTWAERWLKSG